MRSLEGISVARPPVINLDDGHLASFICADFIFKHEEGKAGQTSPSQLSLVSKALLDAAPVTLNSLEINFEGGLRRIRLKHEKTHNRQQNKTTIELAHVVLKEVEVGGGETTASVPDTSFKQDSVITLEGTQNLTLFPGQTRVFEFDIPLREPGDAKATSLHLFLNSETFSLTYSMRPDRTTSPGKWYSSPSSKRKFIRADPRSIKILPRPPKMQIKPLGLLEQYYTNEVIQLELDVINQEDSDAITKMDITLRGSGAPLYQVRVVGGHEQSCSPGSDDRSLRDIQLNTISVSDSGKIFIALDPIDGPTVVDLSMRVSYSLSVDPSTPIIQEASFRLNVVSPFEASYDLLPRIHPEWPNFFNSENIQNHSDNEKVVARPRGLAQKWALVTRYASFAHEEVLVSDLEIEVIATQGNVTCFASKPEDLPVNGQVLSPKTIEERQFELVSQKSSLDDRSPATADLAFIIKWRRIDAPDTVLNITTLPLPRFYVTVSEPRVLATASYSTSLPPSTSPGALSSRLLFLDITIENPSSHFLTFGLTMDPSDEFAFSGAKTTTINVLPIARRSVTYRLLPLVRGTWIRPTLVVRDKYFQKVLKIIPTEGIKSDKDGILLWVPPDDEADDWPG